MNALLITMINKYHSFSDHSHKNIATVVVLLQYASVDYFGGFCLPHCSLLFSTAFQLNLHVFCHSVFTRKIPVFIAPVFCRWATSQTLFGSTACVFGILIMCSEVSQVQFGLSYICVVYLNFCLSNIITIKSRGSESLSHSN